MDWWPRIPRTWYLLVETGSIVARARFVSARRSLASTTIRRRMIRCSGLSGPYYTTAPKFRGFRRRCNGWPSPVGRSTELRIGAGCLHMLGLGSYGCNVPLACCGFLLRSGARPNPTRSTVIADTIHRRVVNHGPVVVHVGDIRDVDIVHGAVVEKSVALPSPAVISLAEISIPIVDAAVK